MWQSTRTRELIGSLRDDEQVQTRTRKRQWLRTHDESEWSLNNSISRARWPFFANVGVVVSLMIPQIVSISEVQMKPRLMMAASVAGT